MLTVIKFCGTLQKSIVDFNCFKIDCENSKFWLILRLIRVEFLERIRMISNAF